MSEPRLSVILATRNRARDLARALASLDREWGGIAEMIVVDNGSSDGTRDVIADFRARHKQLVGMRHEPPGKACALNAALERVTNPCIAFLDDDVFVQPGWADAYRHAFRNHDYPGFQGRIRLPAEARGDRRTIELCQYYRTLPIVDQGDEPSERSVLTGANMAILRAEILAVGGFDARLGPGAAGLSEDTDIARRIHRRTGRAFGYEPRAEVAHICDPERFSGPYFEEYCRRLGRSRVVMKNQRSLMSAMSNMAAAWLRWQWSDRFACEGLRIRHRSRFLVCSEMVRVLRSRS